MDGDEIFVEPVGNEKDMFIVPYTVCIVRYNKVYIKVANIREGEADRHRISRV